MDWTGPQWTGLADNGLAMSTNPKRLKIDLTRLATPHESGEYHSNPKRLKSDLASLATPPVVQDTTNGIVGTIATESSKPVVDICLGAIFIGSCLLDTGSVGPSNIISNYISHATLIKFKEFNLRNKIAIDYSNCI